MTPEQKCKLEGATAAARYVPLSACPYADSSKESKAWIEGHNELISKTAQSREVMDLAVGRHTSEMWKVHTAMEESFRVDGVKDNR